MPGETMWGADPGSDGTNMQTWRCVGPSLRLASAKSPVPGLDTDS